MRVPVTTSEGRQHTRLSAMCVIRAPEELPSLRTDCFFFSIQLSLLCVWLVQERPVSGLPEPPQLPVSSAQAGNWAQRGCAFAQGYTAWKGVCPAEAALGQSACLRDKVGKEASISPAALGPAEGKGQRAEGKSCSFWVRAPGLRRHESLRLANHSPHQVPGSRLLMVIPRPHSSCPSLSGAPEPAFLWNPHWGLRMVNTGRVPGGGGVRCCSWRKQQMP